MDAHSSFVHLVDNIPVWTSNLESLSVHAATKHAEFVAEFTRLVHQIKPKRKKSPSVASIRMPEDEPLEEQLTDVPSLPNKVEINPLEAGNRYLYAQANRKRKPGASVRSGASGPQKFRNKNQVVVYYDALLQEQLDALVKSIGVSRNNLRRGKNSFVAERGFQLPALKGARACPSLDTTRSSMASRSSSPILSGKKAVESVVLQVTDNDEAAFLQVDKELELIQSLCETAAHQFLRDGDCKAELDKILYKFGAVLEQAVATAASLKQLKEQRQALDQGGQYPEASCSALELQTTNVQAKTSMTDRAAVNIHHTLEDMKARGAFFSVPTPPSDPQAALMTDNIEVDDASDHSSIVVDITQYRLANSRRIRVFGGDC